MLTKGKCSKSIFNVKRDTHTQSQEMCCRKLLEKLSKEKKKGWDIFFSVFQCTMFCIICTCDFLNFFFVLIMAFQMV